MATTTSFDVSTLANDEQRTLATMLLENGQAHLFEGWSGAGEDEEAKAAFFDQVKKVHLGYSAGGLPGYLTNARKLLADAAAGKNPFEGFTPEVPEGVRCDYGTPEFTEYEDAGLATFAKCACVLVAGGLGERLGFSGIKVALPAETSTNTCYLELYAQQILSMQAASNAMSGGSMVVPLAIMTSDDTRARTEALLAENDNFGLAPGQVIVMKQEKVAALSDNDARMAADGPYSLVTKPHGHGDVHMLLHQTGLTAKWKAEGRTHVIFFQDTNGLCFNATLASLGISAAKGLDFNSICVPRQAGEAVGAIARLKRADGTSLTINVEYNQLAPLLQATLGHGDENDETGFSPFPGNINQLIVAVDAYAETLERTSGAIEEFVNAKYADETKTTFKKATRLECMMQALPSVMPAEAVVGFSQFPQWTYSPVKNSLEEAVKKAALGILPRCASEGELEFYESNCVRLRTLGCDVAAAKPWTVTGFELPRGPSVVLHPNVGVPLSTLRPKFPSPGDVHIEDGATVIVKGSGVVIEKLTVKAGSALVIDAAEGANVVIKSLTVDNAGWDFAPLADGEDHPEVLAIRGFTVDRRDTKTLTFAAGDHVVEE